MVKEFIKPVYITYEDAQRLIPFFEAIIEHPPVSGARKRGIRILRKLKSVRKDVDYEPLLGQQVFLASKDKEWLLEVMDILGI